MNEEMQLALTGGQSICIAVFLCLSLAFLLIPALCTLVRRCTGRPQPLKRSGISGIMRFSAFLLGAVWCLRYAVGYFIAVSGHSEGDLTWWEEIANSMVHALQTFSMDEDYTAYIANGKLMLQTMLPGGDLWQNLYSSYASVLNVVALVAGGAIIFEILSSLFPRLRLELALLAVWKDKYYFSELNACSLALAKDVHANTQQNFWTRPVIIFTDVYTDDENEKSSELVLEARNLGAVCVRDDLAHVSKREKGNKTFFLIDEKESANLQALTALTNADNVRYLKKAEICYFVTDDAYVQLEENIRKSLLDDRHFGEEELPIFIPVRSYRNLIWNLLDDIPLYEPLIGKLPKADGSRELTVTILGTGFIGTEMFLSTYWLGQLLNYDLKINVLSQESEAEFWSKIDYINPEIRRTTKEGDPLLRINRKGDMAPVYGKVNYIPCNVKASAFINCLTDESADILDTDYFLVSLGTDEDNISVANTVRRYVGQHHIARAGQQLRRGEAISKPNKTVIAYVVYNPELSDALNRESRFSYVDDSKDVFMRAVGSLREVYSVRNVYMTDYNEMALYVQKAYLVRQGQKSEEAMQDRGLFYRRDKLREKHAKRVMDDYKYWSNQASARHTKYRMFSVGFLQESIIDGADGVAVFQAGYQRYARWARGEELLPGETVESHTQLLHKMAWLEHRRWNAFLRVDGFRYTKDYDVYKATGSYKQMKLKLHPCLVECDQNGIHGRFGPDWKVLKDSLWKEEDTDRLDLLDQLAYDLHDKELIDYDFKEQDYPVEKMLKE